MRKNGFTLIELVVTMGIIATLAAIAIPAYSAYTKNANRSDATRTMTLDAQALERCYSQKFNYTDPSCPTAPSPGVPSIQGYYTVTIAVTSTPTASYTITAAPATSPQTSDSACWQFTLNSAGTQGATTEGGANNTKTCWGST